MIILIVILHQVLVMEIKFFNSIPIASKLIIIKNILIFMNFYLNNFIYLKRDISNMHKSKMS